MKVHGRIHSGFKHFIESGKFKLSCHPRIHTGDKTFSCKTCTKTFIESGKLKVHESRIKTIFIQNLWKVFQWIRKIKSSWKCFFLCNNHILLNFVTRSLLHQGSKGSWEESHRWKNIFMQILSTELWWLRIFEASWENSHRWKPYSCQFCAKKFTEARQVKVYERIHASEKPYSCNFCAKKFTESGQLKVHEGNHIGERLYP